MTNPITARILPTIPHRKPLSDGRFYRGILCLDFGVNFPWIRKAIAKGRAAVELEAEKITVSLPAGRKTVSIELSCSNGALITPDGEVVDYSEPPLPQKGLVDRYLSVWPLYMRPFNFEILGKARVQKVELFASLIAAFLKRDKAVAFPFFHVMPASVVEHRGILPILIGDKTVPFPIPRSLKLKPSDRIVVTVDHAFPAPVFSVKIMRRVEEDGKLVAKQVFQNSHYYDPAKEAFFDLDPSAKNYGDVYFYGLLDGQRRLCLKGLPPLCFSVRGMFDHFYLVGYNLIQNKLLRVRNPQKATSYQISPGRANGRLRYFTVGRERPYCHPEFAGKQGFVAIASGPKGRASLQVKRHQDEHKGSIYLSRHWGIKAKEEVFIEMAGDFAIQAMAVADPQRGGRYILVTDEDAGGRIVYSGASRVSPEAIKTGNKKVGLIRSRKVRNKGQWYERIEFANILVRNAIKDPDNYKDGLYYCYCTNGKLERMVRVGDADAAAAVGEAKERPDTDKILVRSFLSGNKMRIAGTNAFSLNKKGLVVMENVPIGQRGKIWQGLVAGEWIDLPATKFNGDKASLIVAANGEGALSILAALPAAKIAGAGSDWPVLDLFTALLNSSNDQGMVAGLSLLLRLKANPRTAKDPKTTELVEIALKLVPVRKKACKDSLTLIKIGCMLRSLTKPPTRHQPVAAKPVVSKPAVKPPKPKKEIEPPDEERVDRGEMMEVPLLVDAGEDGDGAEGFVRRVLDGGTLNDD